MNKQRDAGVKVWMGVPMRWDRGKIFHNLWNAEDERVFPPKYFGIGWDLNLYAVFVKAGWVKSKKKKVGRKKKPAPSRRGG